MLLAALATGALYAAWRRLEGGGRGWEALLGLLVGLGLLAKGPLVAAVAGATALAWGLAGVPARRLLAVAFSPLAWAVALAVAVPWYLAIEARHPGWIAHFATHEHLGRFARADHRGFHPFWFYIPVVLLYLFPWTALSWGLPRAPGARSRIAALATASPWSRRPWREALSAGPTGAGARPADLAHGWFVAAFVLYSLSTRKLVLYLLPAAAPLFVLVGARAAAAGRGGGWRAAAVPLATGLALVGGAALVAAGLLAPLATGSLPSDLEARRHAPLVPWAVGAGAAFLVAGLLLRRAGVARRAGLAGVALVLAAWGALDLGFARAEALASPRALAEAIDAERRAGEVVVSWRRYPQGLGLHTAAPVQIAGGEPGAWTQREIVDPFATRTWRERSTLPPEERYARGGLLTDAEFEALWAGPGRVLAICRFAEVTALRGRVLSGPHAGAGRTDLFLVDNRLGAGP
jgi:4-amino-4-deoxy-L-arabinose transferase-like glycosyltransferase